MRILFIISFFVFGAISVSLAQSDPMFLQQTEHREIINPAAAGKGGDIDVALGLRQQWVGFPGPTTQVLCGSGFVKEIRSGFGLMWLNDKFGPQRTQNLKIDYAYFIPFEEKAFLSLGLGMGILNNTYDGSDFFAMDNNDEAITKVKESKVSPDFDFGLEFNTRYFEVGTSVTHIIYANEDENLLRPSRNIYAYTRAKVPMNKYWDFIPGFTWHNSQKLNTYAVSAAFRYNNNIRVTMIYQTPGTLGIALGITVYKGLRIAYSFDYGIDNLSTYNNGSHEIWVSYNVPINTTYIKSKLRFFKWKMF